MGVLSGLQPEKVFFYFEELTKIPHGSGNVEKISNYLYDFAKARNIEVLQDQMKNIIMIKEASCGYENEPTLILQGHMDMVAVHKPDYDIDMSKEGLKVCIDGDKIYAEGTSLGGDDGIAVAYALAILDSPEIKHPRLEVIITVDEEVGMDGADFIDLSMLKGKTLINLDSEEEGIFLASCAGGARIDCQVPFDREAKKGVELKLSVCGLLGGHSGTEIHRERGNANMLMARVLFALTKVGDIGLISWNGGVADNAIPRDCEASILVNAEEVNAVYKKLEEVQDALKTEYATRDPKLLVVAEKLNETEGMVVCGREYERVVSFIYSLPNGVQAMSMDMPGLVETSLNLGVLELKDNAITARFAVRSSVETSKEALLDKIKAITNLSGGKTETTGIYPGWSYRKDSPFRDKLVKVYKDMYGEEPKVEAVHAGLECGLLAGKIPGLDCISLGPDMFDIHTTEETLSIASTQRVWEYLVRVLETK